MYLKESTTAHLVRSEDLNHHGTLFAGKMALWFLEGGLIAASRLIGRPNDIVCVNLHGITFKKPTNMGNILDVKAKIALLGTTSIMVSVQAFKNEEIIPQISGMATFVTVDKDSKAYAHGLQLPPEYIAENSKIHEEARKIRENTSFGM